MKKLHLLRVAAVGVTAAALTISGASMAAAAEPTVAQGAERPATASAAIQDWSAKAARGSFGIASVGTFAFKSGVLASSGYNFIPGTVTLTDAGVTSVTSEVWVNGVLRGTAKIGPNGALIRGTVGPGVVTLRNPRVAGSGGIVTYPKVSNSFYFRRDTFGRFKVRHAGKKVTMSIRAQIRQSNGAKGTAKRAYVQYAKNGKWKHLKRIKLKSSGRGSYKYSTRSKRKYRLVVKKTSTVQGMTIKLRKL